MAAEAEGLPIRPLDGNDKTRLTLTGLLMEGLGKSQGQDEISGNAYSGIGSE